MVKRWFFNSYWFHKRVKSGYSPCSGQLEFYSLQDYFPLFLPSSFSLPLIQRILFSIKACGNFHIIVCLPHFVLFDLWLLKGFNIFYLSAAFPRFRCFSKMSISLSLFHLKFPELELLLLGVPSPFYLQNFLCLMLNQDCIYFQI